MFRNNKFFIHVYNFPKYFNLFSNPFSNCEHICLCVRVCDPTSYRYLHLKKGFIAFSFTSVFISYWIILKSKIRLIRGYLIMLQEDNFNVRLIFCFLISYNSSINDISISGTWERFRNKIQESKMPWASNTKWWYC